MYLFSLTLQVASVQSAIFCPVYIVSLCEKFRWLWGSHLCSFDQHVCVHTTTCCLYHWGCSILEIRDGDTPRAVFTAQYCPGFPEYFVSIWILRLLFKFLWRIALKSWLLKHFKKKHKIYWNKSKEIFVHWEFKDPEIKET